MSAGGTLFDAIQELLDEEPQHHQIQFLRRSGVKGCHDLFIDTPADIDEFLQGAANRYHDGVPVTIIESGDAVSKAELGWSAYIEQHDLRKESCANSGPGSFAKQKEAYVLENFRDHFESRWQYFLSYKELLDGCNTHGTSSDGECGWERAKRIIEDKIDYLHPKVNASVGPASRPSGG